MSPWSPVWGELGFNCPGDASLSGNLIFVDLCFALKAWRDVCPSLAPTSGCIGRNVAWGWQGCHPSWPEGHCGFEYVESLGALRQVPGAGCKQDDQRWEPASPNSLARHRSLFLERHSGAQEERRESTEGGRDMRTCQVLSEINEHFSPSFVYK